MKIKGTKEDLKSLNRCIKKKWEPIVDDALLYDHCDLCRLDNRRSEEIDDQDDILDFNTVECQLCILNRYVGGNLRCAAGSLYQDWEQASLDFIQNPHPYAVKILDTLREIKNNLEITNDEEIFEPILNDLRSQHENQ